MKPSIDSPPRGTSSYRVICAIELDEECFIARESPSRGPVPLCLPDGDHA